MREVGKITVMIAAFAMAAIPMLSQTTPPAPSFDVISIKPSSGGGPPQLCGPAVAISSPPPLPPPPGGGGSPFDLSKLPRGLMMMMANPAGLTMQATAISLESLSFFLERSAGRTIVDKTGLQGLFDIKLQFSREGIVLPGPGLGAGPAGAGPGIAAPAVDSLPSLFSAIQDLGLRLESAKGALPVLVVESAEKPTEN